MLKFSFSDQYVLSCEDICRSTWHGAEFQNHCEKPTSNPTPGEFILLLKVIIIRILDYPCILSFYHIINNNMHVRRHVRIFYDYFIAYHKVK